MKAAINALTMALLEFDEYRGDVPGAKEFATAFFTENADLFAAPVFKAQSQQQGVRREVIRNIDDEAAIRPSQVFQPRQPGELMPQQAAAVAAGQPLCPNCQQPTNDHLPGCARVGSNGFGPMDAKARTKSPLPAAEA